MHAHDKLGEANVVAVFDSQDEAEDAVYGLRVAGFGDDRIGFYTRDRAGLVIDFLGKTHVLLGTVLGVLLGAALGIWAFEAASTEWNAPTAPMMLPGMTGMIICVVIGAILGGITGAMVGWGVFTRDAVHPGSEVPEGKFVIAVRAADRADAAGAVLHRFGGYELGQPRMHPAAV
jgi:hypothetical protein